MRYFLLFIIRLYWLIPKKSRRRCLFKETCSQYVYRISRQKGLNAGIAALRDRRKKCRPGFYYINSDFVRMADQSILPTSVIST
ncbi:membrane protein insertion efficiency factor YidD [Niabella sp. CJ426]|uniref:membrane protein insertion efficiency factor YidD n=1 Tax=Niabella sp. CJ426 TaxID=3393740 RepID=UPI003D040BE2